MMDRSDSLNVSCRIRHPDFQAALTDSRVPLQTAPNDAAWLLVNLVSDSLPYPAAVPHKILTFVFLNITLESLFSILSPFHGFQESFGSLMLIGYARVSTQDQNLTLQKDALRRRAARKSLKT